MSPCNQNFGGLYDEEGNGGGADGVNEDQDNAENRQPGQLLRSAGQPPTPDRKKHFDIAKDVDRVIGHEQLCDRNADERVSRGICDRRLWTLTIILYFKYTVYHIRNDREVRVRRIEASCWVTEKLKRELITTVATMIWDGEYRREKT
jgi:hypothetical protein